MEQFLIIVGIIWLAVISPGADFALVSRVSFIQGRRLGILVAVGIAVACWFHVAYAMFGLAVVERWFPNLLEYIKIAGVVYLVYLGITTALASPVPSNEDASVGDVGHKGAMLRGILTNALNPKTSIFVVSLYAQAIGPQTQIAAKLGYGFVISASHLLWFSCGSIFLSQPTIRKQVMRRQQSVNRMIGAILILLGILLAATDLAAVS